MISKLLPKFDYIEPNSLKGLQPGFVISQMPVASAAEDALTVTKNDVKFMENGTICDISKDGIIAPTASSKNLFICYSEPLNTILNATEYFAVNLSEEHARLVQLIPGDEWMSTKELDLTGALSGRIVKIENTDGIASDNWYSCNTMANGDKGYHYVYLG